MCTKKILYQAGNRTHTVLKNRCVGEKLNFKQICYTTDCVLAYANAKDVSLSEAAEELKNKGLFPVIYQAARKRQTLPVKQVVKQFC